MNRWLQLAIAVVPTLLAAHAAQPVASSNGGRWIHCSLPGFEVYSDEGEVVTRRRLAELQVTIADVQVLWPTPQVQAYPTGLLVFCSHPLAHQSIDPKIQDQFFYVTPQRNIFLNTAFSAAAHFHGVYPRTFDPPVIDSWGPHLLQRQYTWHFEWLLGERIMPWLRDGLGKLWESAVFEPTSLTLPPLATNPDLQSHPLKIRSKADLDRAIAAKQMLSLKDLLAAASSPDPLQWPLRHLWDKDDKPVPYATSRNGRNQVGPGNRGFSNLVPFNRFIDEAYKVVRFGIFGSNGHRRGPFIRFAQASANGPADEAAFAAVMGIDEESFLLAACQDSMAELTVRYALPGSPTPINLRFDSPSPSTLENVFRAWSAAHAERFYVTGDARIQDGDLYDQEIICHVYTLF